MPTSGSNSLIFQNDSLVGPLITSSLLHVTESKTRLEENLMPFKYSCFISYCHGQGKWIRQFVTKLEEELVNRLDFYLDEPIFLDNKRLGPGYQFNEAIPEAICHSICMIVVYVPKYKRKEYCLREFAAMQMIETQRRESMGGEFPRKYGMIIPIILRGEPDTIPSWISGRYQYVDLSKFATGTDDIFSADETIQEIESIAKTINKIYETFQESQRDPIRECEEFELPSPGDVTVMLERTPDSERELPNR